MEHREYRNMLLQGEKLMNNTNAFKQLLHRTGVAGKYCNARGGPSLYFGSHE